MERYGNSGADKPFIIHKLNFLDLEILWRLRPCGMIAQADGRGGFPRGRPSLKVLADFVGGFNSAIIQAARAQVHGAETCLAKLH
jgi:hypothetical protein